MKSLALVIWLWPATRRAAFALAALAAVLALLAVVINPVLAQGPTGKNGTVKIHDGPGSQEPSPVTRDQSQVGCVFHIHAFNLDPGHSGGWWIREWSPTGDGDMATSGDYLADADGAFEEEVDLTAYVAASPHSHGRGSHFKLFVEGELKHKVFWVTCGQELGPQTPPASPPEQGIGGGVGGPPSPEQSIEGGIGTPGASNLPDTATAGGGTSSPLVAGVLAMILAASLATLAWARLAASRRRS